MIEIRWNPSVREQRQFTLIWLPAFFALIGAMVYWKWQSSTVSAAIWSVGILLTAAAIAIPAIRRPLYVGWMCAAFPIGWTISHAILVFVFYVVVTPIGLLLRLFGHDGMQRRLDRSGTTYWSPRDTQRKAASYFRQY